MALVLVLLLAIRVGSLPLRYCESLLQMRRETRVCGRLLASKEFKQSLDVTVTFDGESIGKGFHAFDLRIHTLPLAFAENVLKAGFSVPVGRCWDTCFFSEQRPWGLILKFFGVRFVGVASK